jgi:ribonuclease E
MGLLVRTEAEGKPEEAVIEDLEVLQRQWETIQQEAHSTRAPALLNRDDDFIQRVLRDMYGGDVNRIVVDSNTGLKRVKQYLQNWSGGQTPQGLLIDHHRDRSPILEYFRINAAVREALRPRVDLPSGGYVIIEPTEALTVIDVNSGSFTRSATARETVLWTNCEAATEIARQLRLRNIAGVIVVDFIDMESRRDQLQVLEHFNKALKADKARPQIAQLTELGLVELTRKRQGQNIYELFGETCPTCGGLGHTVRLPGENQNRLPIPAVEIPERFVPGPQREPRQPATRAVEPREVYEGFSEGFEGDPDQGSMHLIHHPSYQELADQNKRRNRTRRSRIGLNGGNGKDESRFVANSMAFVNEPDLDLDPESELVTTTEIPSPSLGKSGWNERGERAKVKIEPVKPMVEPPEVISVEMSRSEQDVFALMGVSPTVKLDREVKSHKSLIINIVQPGELGNSPSADLFTPSIAEPTTTTVEPTTVEPTALESTAVEQKGRVTEISSSIVNRPTPKTEREEPIFPQLQLDEEFVSFPGEHEINQTSTPNRRIRRRSSALGTDNSSGEES